MTFNPQPKPKFKKKSKAPTKEQRKRWGQIVELGCCVNNWECYGRVTVHHCFTGGGGRKDHDEVIPLCVAHHTSHEFGIDGRGKFSKITWQEHYQTEEYYINEINSKLEVYLF